MMPVGHITALSNEQLGNLRGQICCVEGCSEYDCLSLCNRCCKRHGALVQVKPGCFRTVCERCSRERECASCEARLPRYLLVYTGNDEDEGELFCESCCGVSPLEDW